MRCMTWICVIIQLWHSFNYPSLQHILITRRISRHRWDRSDVMSGSRIRILEKIWFAGREPFPARSQPQFLFSIDRVLVLFCMWEEIWLWSELNEKRKITPLLWQQLLFHLKISPKIFLFSSFFSLPFLCFCLTFVCVENVRKKKNFPFFLLLNVEKMKKKKNRESIYTPKHKCKPCRRRHRIPFHSHPFHPEIIPCPTHPRTWT